MRRRSKLVLSSTPAAEDPLKHLRNFREDETSYQALLGALREVVHKHEREPPFGLPDIWGRHPFFYENPRRYLNASYAPSRRPMTEARQKAHETGDFSDADATTEEEEPSVETRRTDLLRLIDMDETVDLRGKKYYDRAAAFFRLALSRGDLCECREILPFVSNGGFALTQGGFVKDPNAESRFYEPDERAREVGARRKKERLAQTATDST